MDTSVSGGCFDPEFKESSGRLLEEVQGWDKGWCDLGLDIERA